MVNRIQIFTYPCSNNLTSVNVDYTPDGQVSTFGNGMPTHIKMSLEFTEDRMLTKRDIIKGA